MKKNSTTDWDGVADWYDQLVGQEGNEYQQKVVLPGVLRLLGLGAGEKALDLACGQGVLCRLLAERGIETTGIDAAAQLIAAARKRNESLSPGQANLLHYLVGDVGSADVLPSEHFDAVACVLAIQNINPIAPVMKTAARTLKHGGKFVLVMMHPCFRGAKETSWGWDEKQSVQYRRVDRYLLPRKTPIVTHPGKDPGTYTWTFRSADRGVCESDAKLRIADRCDGGMGEPQKKRQRPTGGGGKSGPGGDSDVHGDSRGDNSGGLIAAVVLYPSPFQAETQSRRPAYRAREWWTARSIFFRRAALARSEFQRYSEATVRCGRQRSAKAIRSRCGGCSFIRKT